MVIFHFDGYKLTIFHCIELMLFYYARYYVLDENIFLQAINKISLFRIELFHLVIRIYGSFYCVRRLAFVPENDLVLNNSYLRKAIMQFNVPYLMKVKYRWMMQ